MTDIHYKSEDGLTLYAKSYGPATANRTVLCLHGLTRNHKDFEPMIEALGEAHPDIRFVAWDTRGRCKSAYDPDPSRYALPNYASDAVRLIDTLGLEKVTLIGTSMGGLISMTLMTMIPTRIDGIVLNDIGPVIELEGLQNISTYLGKNDPLPSMSDAAAKIEANQKDVFPDYTDADWLSFAERTWRQRPDGQFEPDYDASIVENFAVPTELNEDDPALWGLFNATNSVPLLLIRGERSELLSEKTAARMMDSHPNARLATIPRVGHAPVLDEPEAVNAISGFLGTL
ncbi:MAG: alpha/beta hydrolase [Ponticaulis sp.]|nr:alpha/beta hydrolase [Ponticaulis sp.]